MRYFKTLFILILLVAFSFGCSDTEKTTRTVNALYPHYSSLEELVDRSSLIIKGEVLNSRVEVLDISMEPENPTEENSPGEVEKAEHINTVSEIEISRVYHGDIEEGEIIEVKQMGGETENAILISEQGAYLEEGENAVLFLETYENSPASLLNPIQAHYIVEDDKLIKFEDNDLNFELEDLEEISSE